MMSKRAVSLALAVAVVTTLASPLGRAQSQPAIRPAFDVASVKFHKPDAGATRSYLVSYGPEGITFAALSLGFMIGEAYDFPVGRIVFPDALPREILLGSLGDGYDVVARAGQAVSADQLRLMLQSLLADRFKLALHREARTGPRYRLVVAKGGPRFAPSTAGGGFSLVAGPDGTAFHDADMARLAGFLSSRVDRVVVDQTGLQGTYEFTLKQPADDRQSTPAVKDGVSPDTPSAAMFADALQQLGLQLVADRGPIDYLVVDHAETPSEN
jgi:uncharacterized protein (TIGR03435 family)